MNLFTKSVVLGIFLAGCGGSSSGARGGTGGTGGDGGSGGDGGAMALPIPGSFELVVEKVTATARTQGGPVAPVGVTSPSEAQSMRLDVRRGQGGAIEAVLTPRWGLPARVDGSASDDSYRLTGDAVVSGGSTWNVSDHWTTLRIAAAGAGLGTAVTLEGTEDVVEGDILWSFDLVATAVLRKDVTPPELRSKPASVRGPADALLPWDPIEVDIAEPIARADLESHASVVSTDLGDAGLSPLQVGWQYAPADEGTSWAGVVRAYARFDGWDHPPTQMTNSYELRAAAGIPDATGLVSKVFKASFVGLDVGSPVLRFTFDASDEQHPASWGLVTFRGAAASARCEQGGCLEIGPYDAPYCGTGRHGVAGRVQAPTGTLEVRYRLLYASDPSAPDQPANPYGAAFVIDIAHAAGEVTTQKVDSPQSTLLSDLGAGAGELRWAAPWTTASVALPGPTPPSVIDLGFSIGSADAVSDACVGGPLPAPVKTLVVIDAISGR